MSYVIHSVLFVIVFSFTLPLPINNVTAEMYSLIHKRNVFFLTNNQEFSFLISISSHSATKIVTSYCLWTFSAVYRNSVK